jgi:hypothetical protein
LVPFTIIPDKSHCPPLGNLILSVFSVIKAMAQKNRKDNTSPQKVLSRQHSNLETSAAGLVNF